MNRLKQWIKRNYKTKDIGSQWVREMERAKTQHYHVALFIDGELQVSEKDEKKYSGQFVSSALNLNSSNSTAAIIGGGDAGVARECISKGFNLIDWY